MAGRIYKIRSRRPVNRFTWEDYGNFCQDIKGANPVSKTSKNILVTVSKGRTNLAAAISQILKQNNINTISYNKHMGSNKVVRMVFSSQSDAQKASDIVNLMSTPDSITESNIRTDGTVVSDYGVNVKVDVTNNPDGTVSANAGGNYVTTAQAAAASDTGTEDTDNMSRWFIIGGVALLAVIIVLAVWKKMSK